MKNVERIHFLDNIRWSTVILVMLYHVFYMFNAEGIPGGVGCFASVQPQDALLTFVYPWFMVLLFVISGICSALELKQNPVGYLKKRSAKLLPPCTLGLLVWQWMVGYYNIKIGGALSFIPAFLVYPLSVLSGIGPLWFIQMLWLFDLLVWLLQKWDGCHRFQEGCRHLNLAIIVSLFLGLWGCSWIGNLPIFTMYRFGIYLFSFLSGYFVFSSETNRQAVIQRASFFLFFAVITGIIFTALNFDKNYTEQHILGSFLCNIYAWLAVLAVMGVFGRWFNKTNLFAEWMTRNSWGLYILHYSCVLIPCYYLKEIFQLPELVCYLLALILVFTLTPILNWMIERIPGIRYAVLGRR